MSVAIKARKHLIQIGKLLPFALCFVVMLGYIESAYATLSNNIVLYDCCFTIEKPISQLIGCYFEYDWMTIIVLTILAFATETCVWNKLSVLYLALHLLFKQWASTMEFLPMHIVGLCLINIIICAILTYNGLKRI